MSEYLLWFVLAICVQVLPLSGVIASMLVSGMPVRVLRKRDAVALLEDAERLARASGDGETALLWWENRVGAFAVGWCVSLGVVDRLFDAAWRKRCEDRGWSYSPLTKRRVAS